MKLEIREAHLNDALKIRNTHVRSIRELCRKDYTRRQIQAWTQKSPEDYRKAIKSGAVILIAVSSKGQVAGLCWFHENQIHALYVHPLFVGHGVGRRLLLASERLITRKNFKTVRLNSTRTALKFYLSQGYKKIRSLQFILPIGVKIPCTMMKKTFR